MAPRRKPHPKDKTKKPQLKSTVPSQSVFGKSRGWQLFNMISLIAVVVILLSVVVGNEGFAGFLRSWRQLKWNWMAAALGCMAVYYLLEGLELHILVQSLYHGLSYRSSLRTGMIGLLYSALTPFATGGQPVQLMYMVKDGLDTGGAGSVLTFKSFFYQIGTLVYTAVAAVTTFHFFDTVVPSFQLTFVIALVPHLIMTLGMLFLMLSETWTVKFAFWIIRVLHRLHIIKDPESARERTRKQFSIFHQSSLVYGRKWGVLLGVMLSTLVQMLALYSVPFMIYRACGYTGGSQDLFLMISAAALVTVIAGFVPLPGGSGGAEGMFLLLFAPIFPADKLLMGLLIWRLFTYYLNIALGGLVMFSARRRQRAVVRLPLSPDPREEETPSL